MEVGQYCEILSGFAFKSSLFNTNGEGMPIIRIRDIQKENSNTFYSGDYKNSYIVKKGDFLIAMDGEFKMAKWKGKDSLLNQRVCKISFSEEVADRDYMFYMLPRQLKFIEDTTSFVTVKHLSVKKIKAIQIPLPPLPTQKKIAALLDEADKLRRLNAAVLEKYDALLKGILYSYLGNSINKDKRRINVGTNEYLPNGFKWTKLKDICEKIADIDHKMPKSVEEGKLFLSAKDLADNGDLDFSKAKMISEEDFQRLSRKIKPRKGDIIYSRIGAKLGKARLVKTDHEFIVSYSCCTIRPKHETISNVFLRYYLDSEQTLRQASHGTRSIGVPDLGMNEVRNFLIPLPPNELMNSLESQIKNVESQKAKAKAAFEQSEELFNALLQRSFSGA
jgi:type I restriction enzyme S subunit